jgi:hypothetical protein
MSVNYDEIFFDLKMENKIKMSQFIPKFFELILKKITFQEVLGRKYFFISEILEYLNSIFVWKG